MRKVLLILMFSLVVLGGLVNANGGVGGTITKDGNYYVHTFTSNGSFNWSGSANNISFLIVGGGGAGGQDTIGASGGGGAGGYIYNNSASITANTYSVKIGLGGNSSGANSSFNFSTLQAGGGGIGQHYAGAGGEAGGSGGGASQNGAGGFAGISGQGFAGGSGGTGAGGGGGASAVGSSNSGSTGGAGGFGHYNSINGTNFTWACGGGGAGNSGGGNGAGGCATAGAGKGGGGVNNTGSGGGGGGEGTSMGTGGSGIVIIRYLNLTSIIPTLVTPANNTNTTNQSVPFVVTIDNSTSAVGITNVSLYINGTLNQTNTSQMNGSYTFNVAMPFGSWNWTVQAYGNDTSLNNATNGVFNLNVKPIVFFNYQFDNQTIEQTSSQFKVNLSIASTLSLTAINITYNQTNYSASFTSTNSTYAQAMINVTTPSVVANINKTFNWTAYAGSLYFSDSQLQTVLNLGIDNCSVNTVQILNLSLVDEDTQLLLNATTFNTSIKIDMSLYSNPGLTSLTANFSSVYNSTNSTLVCISASLGSAILYQNAQIEYSATTYAHEFLNIQNYSLNASSNPSQNLTLYDLNESFSQPYTISFKDSSFLAVPGALIQVQRKYVNEGVFKTVEAPITDISGQTVAHLVTNDVIYSFTVVKNGVILATFQSQNAICQNPLVSECRIDLNSFSSSISVTNFTSAKDFLYTLTYNNNTRVVSSVFTIPSGTVSTMLLNVTSEDALGSAVCSQTVTTSAGTLSCTVPSSFGDKGTIKVTLYKDGGEIAFGQINLNSSPSQTYNGIYIFIILFMMVSLIGASLSDNPILMVISLAIGIILMISLDVVSNSAWLGGTATILFLFIAFVIVIVKGGKRG